MKLRDFLSYNRRRCYVLILVATIVAIFLRVPRLSLRPMHSDEAVHAEKFRLLLEEGTYIYNPGEYHGPTLNYFTLIPARLCGAENLTEVTEFTLRIVPVFFGILLILMLLFIPDALGRAAVVCAAFVAAISPAMVFYSRYYIQEMLLVCFTFSAIVCAYRYIQSTNIAWILLSAIFVGLAHATKETCIIAFGSALLAVLITILARRKTGGSLGRTLESIKSKHIIIAFIVALMVSALFYSSFFQNPKGFFDSLRAYAIYLSRAEGDSHHIHAWYYYLRMLIFSRYGQGPIWTEAFIVLLAVVGFIAAITKKGLYDCNIHFVRFIAFYTLAMTVFYSMIPYKTPWCLLGFLHGMILLAGVGAMALVAMARKTLPRLIVILLLIGAFIHLGWQSYRGNYIYYADTCNPYVYAHPTTDVFTIAQFVDEYAQAHKAGQDMHIEVICPDHDYWPLPWYLRSFTHVGWRDTVDDEVASAPLIIVSTDLEEALTKKLYSPTLLENRQMYLYLFDKPYYLSLRPDVHLLGLVRRDLWDRVHSGQP
jgi:uncharacterized protein (TIGR03663 family)